MVFIFFHIWRIITLKHLLYLKWLHFSFAVKPYFLQEPDDVTALNGEDIILECEVGGDPNPTILWHREDGTLPQGRTRIQNGKLNIQNVSPKDEGVYVCEAQNTVGTISVSASVAVHGKYYSISVTKFLFCKNVIKIGHTADCKLQFCMYYIRSCMVWNSKLWSMYYMPIMPYMFYFVSSKIMNIHFKGDFKGFISDTFLHGNTNTKTETLAT